jgi:toxin ParE1/3/4
LKRRPVIFAPEARLDLAGIEKWLSAQTSVATTEAFLARILTFCGTLETASERGHRRDDVRAGLRIVGFERRMTIAFAVHEDRVEILRIFQRGRDWKREFEEN